MELAWEVGGMLEWQILVLVGGGLVAILVVGALIERRRTQGLQRAAGELGLSFAAHANDLLESPFGRFHLFQQGRARTARNVLSGRLHEREVYVFDYDYKTGSGRHTHTHRQTVAAMRLDEFLLPQFELRPENVFHRIGAAFGYQDVDLDGYPEFSSRYLLRGPEADTVRRFFEGGPAEFLQDRARICIEGGQEWLVIYRAGRRTSAADLPRFLEEVFEIRAALAKTH
jgi:hypothetical protein